MPDLEHEHEHDAFRLPTDLADEAKTARLTRALLSAAHDPRPAHTLAQIHTALAAPGVPDLRGLLDPLAVLPDVLQSTRAGAEDVLAVLGDAASAKEVVMGAQEIMERLEADDDDDDDDDDETDDGAGAGNEKSAKTDEEPDEKASLATRVARLMALYARAVPRLNQRRPALDTLQSIMPDLEPLVYHAAARATATESRALVAAASSLATSAHAWAQAKAKAEDDADADTDAVARCTVLLASVLDATLEACARNAACSLAQRAFEAHFSRLVVRSAVRSGWEAGEDAMSAAVAASKALGRTSASLQSSPSIAALILLAHASPPEPLTPAALTPLLPVLLSALDIGVADEPLYLILLALLPSPSSSPPPASTDLPPDLVLPLTPVLASLCSAHPDPPTRHLAFRLLSLALRATPSPLRLQVLRDLTDPAADAHPPQMRAAAVGLAKESVLAALAAPAAPDATEPGAPAASADVFASPALLSALGAHVFRAHPPDLFVAAATTADAFMRSAEPARLAECLALYYVLLRRDVQNRTGIRDRDTIRNIEATFVGPMRAAVARWLVALGDELHAVMPLAALQTNIERVDAAVSALALAPAE